MLEIRLTGTQSSFSFNAISYSPSFVSLYDVSRGEEVKRVRAGNKSDKLRAVGSSDCVVLIPKATISKGRKWLLFVTSPSDSNSASIQHNAIYYVILPPLVACLQGLKEPEFENSD
ncbi:hypothetical protein Prudu_001212 [Prunus dulcis]|uniref:Uncharacterized protein n=1 Tax=Prunus dulcis TaxID=3755 RepID=A0A4Y1QN18_PRUDU|nr:hypothetical protein Prudu_001212 [Prunus dulcis]